jgi:hypothetical protein
MSGMPASNSVWILVSPHMFQVHHQGIGHSWSFRDLEITTVFIFSAIDIASSLTILKRNAAISIRQTSAGTPVE